MKPHEDTVIALGDYVASVNPSSGALIWRSKATRNCSDLITDLNEKNLLALTSTHIFVLQSNDGKIINKVVFSGAKPIAGASFSDGSLILQTDTTIDYYSDRGERLWQKK